MRWFYTNKLGIPEVSNASFLAFFLFLYLQAEIPSIMWSNVVDQLVLVPGLCRTGELTHLQVAQRILRKENYLIALINRDILALHLPFVCCSRSQVITKSMEWSLSSSLFQVLFEKSKLKYSYEEVLHKYVAISIFVVANMFQHSIEELTNTTSEKTFYYRWRS